MSSSAFFIEAAANTVRFLSWADADEKTDPHRIAKAYEKSGKPMHGRAPCLLAALFARAKSGSGQGWNATGGSAVPLLPATYGRSGYRVQKP